MRCPYWGSCKLLQKETYKKQRICYREYLWLKCLAVQFLEEREDLKGRTVIIR